MNSFSKLRRLVEDLQKIRPRAFQLLDSGDTLQSLWSRALDALKKWVDLPPINPRRFESEQNKSEQTPLQKAILEFVETKWPNGNVPRTAKVHQAMEQDSKVWRSIATKHGVRTNSPDWHTINRTLGREV